MGQALKNHGATGLQLPPRLAGELTDRQRRFVLEFVRGYPAAEAAQRVGYARPVHEADQLLGKPNVMAAISAEQHRMVRGECAHKAVRTVMQIMDDKTAPAASRVSAARLVFEAAGWIGQRNRELQADPDRDLNAMSPTELGKLLSSTRQQVVELRNVLNGNGNPQVEATVTVDHQQPHQIPEKQAQLIDL